MFTRYALYYAPAPGSALAGLGAAWLGRDAASGPVAQVAPALPDGCRAMAELTVSARRYGLHGTLKPPMRLAEGRGADDLIRAARDWAAGRKPVDLGPLRVGALGPFLALVPVAQPQALMDFAADLVRDLDGFRAPAGAAELAKRRRHGLSPRQEQYLADWGYPHVMEELRFHITLTDALAEAERAPLRAAAEAHFGPALGGPEVMRDLAVFGEGADGTFHQITRLPLAG